MTGTTRLLGPGDEALLERFLLRHADASMFLRSNARAAGLADTGATFSATWVAEVAGGEAVAVAAHCWNGVLVLQAPGGARRVAREAVARSRRRVSGICGPWEQVVAARSELGLAQARTSLVDREDLFALDLDRLEVPPALAGGRVSCRAASPADLPLLLPWRVAYCVETLGQRESEELVASSRKDLEDLLRGGNAFVLSAGADVVSFSGFNARLPDSVQVGGVYTPPALRGRGHARSAVAGSLLSARRHGASRAVLFTGAGNLPARRAYEALGFAVVGDYGVVLL